MNKYNFGNMSDICRICLEQKNDMFSIYDKYSDEYNEPIFCMIMYCASVRIEKGDGMPDLLCTICKTRLETAYLFKRDCEQSENKLRQTIRINCSKLKSENNDSNHSRQIQNSNEMFPTIKLEVDSETESYYHGNNNIKSEDPLGQNVDGVTDMEQPNNNRFYTFVLKQEVSCVQSDTSFKVEKSDYKQEDDSDTEQKFCSNTADVSAKKRKRHRNYVKRENGSKFRKFICYQCSKIFFTKDEFMIHTAENHPNHKYVCDFENCNHEFADYMKYATHCKTDHYVENFLVCQQCQSSYRHKKNLDRHILSKHCDRPHECIHCSQKFQDIRALDLHMNIHLEKYKCEICKKCFALASGLDNHKRVHTNEDPSHTCDECDKKFTTKLYLERHVCDQNHKAENKEKLRRSVKNHLCAYCGQRFRRPIDLTIHIRLHTGVKPYSCDQCEYRCHNKHLLQSHLRSHSGDRPYKCSYCEKAFGTKGYLTIHERFHSGHRPYICSTCQKGFTNSKDLKVHERTHTGIKLFSCDICGNSFTTLHYLRVHKKKHENGV